MTETADLLSDASDIEAAFRNALAPHDPPPILEWATQNFRLSPKDSASPGLVTLDPWQREVLATLDDPTITQVVVAASSQTGKTLLGLILANYAARHRPGPALFIHENDISAEAFAKDRIQPSLEANAADILIGARGRGGQTTTRKEFSTGGTLSIVGAQTPANLSGRPASTLIATEVRGFPISAGKDGDPLSLALARGKAFPSFKAFIESSPGLLNRCRLTEQAELGDMRRWHLPCRHCGHSAPVDFEPTPGSHSVSYTHKAPEKAAIACCECGTLWTARERLDAIRAGTFKPTRTAADPTIASFHYSELESLRSDLGDVVKRYLAARRRPERMQAFTNTVLGLPFDPDQSVLDVTDGELAGRAEHFDGTLLLPDGVFSITAGVDTQVDRLEIQVVGHGPRNRRWSLDYLKLPGDPNGVEVWQRLETFLLTSRYKHPLGGELAIKTACIDSGGKSTQTVIDWCASQLAKGRPYFAIKGTPGEKPIVRKSRNSYLRKGDPFKLILVGVDTAKNEIFGALNNTEATEATITFPDKYAPDFFKGIVAEKQRITVDKKGAIHREYVRTDRSVGNEPLDTLVYALAAWHLIHPAPDYTAIARSLADTSPKQTFAEQVAERAKRLAAHS